MRDSKSLSAFPWDTKALIQVSKLGPFARASPPGFCPHWAVPCEIHHLLRGLVRFGTRRGIAIGHSLLRARSQRMVGSWPRMTSRHCPLQAAIRSLQSGRCSLGRKCKWLKLTSQAASTITAVRGLGICARLAKKSCSSMMSSSFLMCGKKSE